MLSEFLMRFLACEMQVAGALTVQLHKVVLQVGLDSGDWSMASLLCPFSDPLAAEELAGEPAEMMATHRWKKAMSELRARPNLVEAAVSDEGLDEKQPQYSRRNRAEAKAKAGAAGTGQLE